MSRLLRTLLDLGWGIPQPAVVVLHDIFNVPSHCVRLILIQNLVQKFKPSNCLTLFLLSDTEGITGFVFFDVEENLCFRAAAASAASIHNKLCIFCVLSTNVRMVFTFFLRMSVSKRMYCISQNMFSSDPVCVMFSVLEKRFNSSNTCCCFNGFS